MTRMWMRSGMHRGLMVFVAGGLLLGASAGAQANEEGMGGLLQRLFSPQPQAQPLPPAQQATVSPQERLPTLKKLYGRRYAQRPEGARLRPKVRYASLPKPGAEPLEIRISDRQVALDMKDGPSAAFLKDKTLRPGDIVVLKEGARVFTGNPDKSHSLKDFESIGRSAFIDRHTRTQLTAMLVPVGAMTEVEARKRLVHTKTFPLGETTSIQVQASAMRIIYPWTIAP